ncbi:meteorin-like protein isoform X2 [Denticeps clupeoides]|uniref:Meteorin-like protein n=1 Tax=Denticeps clupeoides TaxID=299321 RepID=A0AAY3ZZ04_9TELE|nr:meteorin-like protein isoform X2 [Denticeps clupeoides]
MPSLSPALALLVAAALWRRGLGQYTSDQCNWRGSGLTHESHTRDVEQVYLRCSQGSLEWLYPTGAVVVNLRPNLEASAEATKRLRACVKARAGSRGANVYLERAGALRLLLGEDDQARGAVRCFGLQEGALFVEALPRRDIGRRATAFLYELSGGDGGDGHEEEPHSSAACRPCSDASLLMAVCTSDFVGKGTVRDVVRAGDHAALRVTLARLYRQKDRVFVSGAGAARGRWAGSIRAPLGCGVRPDADGDLLFTGSVRFGEAWLSCAARYRDFVALYRVSLENGTNPCNFDTD